MVKLEVSSFPRSEISETSFPERARKCCLRGKQCESATTPRSIRNRRDNVSQRFSVYLLHPSRVESNEDI